MYNWNFLNVSVNLKNYRQYCWCKEIIDKLLISAKSYLSPTTSAWWIPLAYLSNDFPGHHCSAAWFSWPLISGSMSYRWVAACKVDISVNTAKLGEHITPKPYSNRDYLCTSKRCQNSCNTSFCSDVQIKASSLNSHCLANFTAQSWVQEDICNRFILSNCLIILFFGQNLPPCFWCWITLKWKSLLRSTLLSMVRAFFPFACLCLLMAATISLEMLSIAGESTTFSVNVNIDSVKKPSWSLNLGHWCPKIHASHLFDLL